MKQILLLALLTLTFNAQAQDDGAPAAMPMPPGVAAKHVVFETTVCPEHKGLLKKQTYKVTPLEVTVTSVNGILNLQMGAPMTIVQTFKVVDINKELAGVGIEVKFEGQDSVGKVIETIHYNRFTHSIRTLGQSALTVSNCNDDEAERQAEEK